MKSLATLTLLFNPTLPALGISALYVWLFIRMKRDPQWRVRGLAVCTATTPVVVPTDR